MKGVQSAVTWASSQPVRTAQFIEPGCAPAQDVLFSVPFHPARKAQFSLCTASSTRQQGKGPLLISWHSRALIPAGTKLPLRRSSSITLHRTTRVPEETCASEICGQLWLVMSGSCAQCIGSDSSIMPASACVASIRL
eukprot:scaffold11787_cov15-Tisochrysis_lutea.AAC.2